MARGGGKAHRLTVGAFEVRKVGASGVDARDPYHLALTVGWPTFVAVLLAIYAAITAVFALVYWLLPGPIGSVDVSSFSNALFFSFEVLSTSGYVGLSMDALLARVVATAEIVCGLAFIAIMMGLVFVRFSQAKAKILFADKAVVAMHNGRKTLMIRVGNGRAHALTNASATLNAMVRETTLEGNDFFNIQELKLVRQGTPFFPLTLNLMHVIDEASLLYGMTPETLAQRGVVIFASFDAYDPKLAAMVSELRIYAPGEVAFAHRYLDAVTTLEDGTPVADLNKLSLIAPETPVAKAP